MNKTAKHDNYERDKKLRYLQCIENIANSTKPEVSLSQLQFNTFLNYKLIGWHQKKKTVHLFT